MRKESVFRGTMVLTLAGLLSRAMGLAYRIYLVRLVGAEVIGLYQMIFPIYSMGLVLATVGVPVAVSQLVAHMEARRDIDGIRGVVTAGFRVSILASAAITACLIVLAAPMSQHVLTDSRTYLAMVVIAPSLPIVSIAAVIRGYLQGTRQMTPLGAVLVLEQVVHVGSTLALVLWLKPVGEEVTAGALALGSVLSDVIGTAALLALYRKERRVLSSTLAQPRAGGGPGSERRAPAPRYRQVLGTALPVSGGRLVATGLATLEAVLIPNRLLVAGFSVQQATVLYGELAGMALTLLFVPSIFTTSLGTNMVPEVSAAKAAGDWERLRRSCGTSMRVTTFLTMPLAFLFLTLGLQMGDVLFRSRIAGQLLVWMALPGFFVYLQPVFVGILHGLGRPGLALWNSIIAAACGVILIYVLTAQPELGVMGAAIGISAAFVVGAVLNGITADKLTRFMRATTPFLLRLVPASMLSAMCGRLAWEWLSSGGRIGEPSGPGQVLTLLVAICVGAVSYLPAAAMVGVPLRRYLGVVNRFLPWLGATGRNNT